MLSRKTVKSYDDGKPLEAEKLKKYIGKTEIRHKKFARNLITTGDATIAYKKTYPKASVLTAKNRSKVLLANPDVQDDIRKLLNYQGLTIEKLNSELIKIIENPDKEVITKCGDIVTLKDNSLKLQAIIHGHKLHGVTDKAVVNVDNRSVTINADPEQLNLVCDRMKEMGDMMNLTSSEGEIV
jgi:hypothetical protein